MQQKSTRLITFVNIITILKHNLAPEECVKRVEKQKKWAKQVKL